MATALPPYVLHATVPLSPLAALTALTAFLDSANNTPAYRPDSTLTERGPISSSTSNLTLHHLSRLKLGLEGTRIGAAEIEAEDASLALPEEPKQKGKRDEPYPETPRRVVVQGTIPLVRVATEDDELVVETMEGVGGEWEAKDEYELAQDDEEFYMNTQRDPAGELEQPTDPQEMADEMEVEETQAGSEVPLPLQDSQETIEKTVVDKEERKRLKKLRQLQEKKQAEEKGKARGTKDMKQNIKK